MNAFIHRQPFDLLESGRVRRVERVLPVHHAGHQGANRQRLIQQTADLHR